MFNWIAQWGKSWTTPKPAPMPKRQVASARDKMPDDLLEMLCEGSDRQIDDCIKPRLLALRGRSCAEAKGDLLGIIGDCINGSLCSSFVLTTLQLVLYVDFCGGKPEECVGKVRNDPIPMG